jgi:alkanesulfonate monooxygenase SsuD/methylene tetrahydromethanopterin reductase-like flavin-dependent oxidoreductase (luciferase family)
MGYAFGVNVGLAPEVAGELAAACVELGYHSLWTNDEPDANGLETLAHFAAAAPSMDLGVGVLPLHRFSPQQIAADIDRLGLDPSRLWLGIGSGQLCPQLDAVQQAVEELRRLLPPQCRIVIAAMRPRMCRVGGAIADAVLLNWMLPAHAAAARQWVHEGAEAAGRDPPTVALYVRVAVGAGAEDRLRADEGRYRVINDSQRRHFAAMNTPLGSVGVAVHGRPEVLDGLVPYRRAVDLPIVRALAHPAAALLEVARAAAPTQGRGSQPSVSNSH